ncbi:MAG: hypothetical protein LCH81_01160 [Bacteroidetes bacterium]|nr:hypothetical protein [Bacteroidota bacterium]
MKPNDNFFHHPIYALLQRCLLILPIFLTTFSDLCAQTETIFYRSWVQHTNSFDPTFINHIVSEADNAHDCFYVAGSTKNTINTYSLSITKYLDPGVEVWNRRFNLDTLGNVHVADVAVDTSGNVLVTGSAYNGATNLYDLFVVKYNPSGTKLWQYVYNGSSGIYDSGTAITCAANGDVFVSGVTWPDLFDTDALTLRLNSSGTQQWLTTFDNVSLNDAAGTIDLDGSLVIITGFTQNTATEWAYFVARYNVSNGTVDSQRIIDEEGTEIEQVNAATVDAEGNIYITGSLGSGSNGFDVRTVTLDPDLVVLWTDTWNGAGDADDMGRSIVVDEDKNVMVVGYTTDGGDRDALLLQYNAGSLINSETYDGGEGNDEYTQLLLGADGNMMVSGYSTKKGNIDFLSAYYASNGTLLWSETYNGLLNKDDKAQHISKGKGEDYIISGSTRDPENENLETVLSIRYIMHELVKPQDEAVTAPFVENRGQLLYTNGTSASSVRYYSRSTYPNLFLTDETAHFVFSHIDTSAITTDTIVRLNMDFADALPNRPAPAVGVERQDWFHNYYYDHIPGGRERTPLSNKVLFPSIYEYTDAIFGQGDDGNFIRFIFKPGSDPDDLKLEFTGATAISVLLNGDLKVETILEDLILPAPEAMTVSSTGVETEITAWTPEYYIGLDGKVKIVTDTYDSGKTLIVRIGKDRGQTEVDNWWSTYYGWTDLDNQSSVDYDEAFNLYSCGNSRSVDFPVNQFVATPAGKSDWTVNKFSTSGFPQWFTMIGGGDEESLPFRERAYDISAAGTDLYVGGLTDLAWGTLPNENGGFQDADFSGENFTKGVIARLAKSNGVLMWATLFGDANALRGGVLGVQALQGGGVAVVGYSQGITDEEGSLWQNVDPGGAAFQQDEQEGTMYIAEFNEGDNLVWATKFGPSISPTGNISHAPADITEDGNGRLFVVGSVENDETSGDFFPSGPGGGMAYSDGKDGFLAGFGADRSLMFATYIGGTEEDYATGVACDPTTGDVVVLGTAKSSISDGFPLQSSGNPLQDDNTLGGASDLFIMRFASNGNLVHSRYFGGENDESTDPFTLATYNVNPVNGLAIDGTGSVFITGSAEADLPTLWPEDQPEWFFEDFSGNTDAFVAAFASNFKLEYCTYLGGSARDHGSDVAVTNGVSHIIAMVGRTEGKSNNYPTSGPDGSYLNQQSLGGQMDGVISVIKTNYYIVRTQEVLLPESFISLSPNPCTDMLTVTSKKDDMKPVSACLYDITGRLMARITLSEDQETWTIPVRDLRAGTYRLVLDTGSGLWSGLFVKID